MVAAAASSIVAALTTFSTPNCAFRFKLLLIASRLGMNRSPYDEPVERGAALLLAGVFALGVLPLLPALLVLVGGRLAADEDDSESEASGVLGVFGVLGALAEGAATLVSIDGARAAIEDYEREQTGRW